MQYIPEGPQEKSLNSLRYPRVLDTKFRESWTDHPRVVQLGSDARSHSHRLAECLFFCDFQYGKRRTVAPWLKIPILGNEKSHR
jgi:hypothetical protein